MRNRKGPGDDDESAPLVGGREAAPQVETYTRSQFLICYLYMALGWFGGLAIVFGIGSLLRPISEDLVKTEMDRVIFTLKLHSIPAFLFWFSTFHVVKTRLSEPVAAIDPIVSICC